MGKKTIKMILNLNEVFKMKKFTAILLTLVLIFTLAACNGTNDEDSSSQSQNQTELKKVTFCLDWTPNTNHTGLFAAQAKGYYKDAGFDVTIIQSPEDSAELMCASGEAQFAISFQDTMAASLVGDSPLGITAVAAVLQHNTSGIMSRKGEGMDTPKGLEGKKYATWDSPIEKAMIDNVMKADGGADFSKVKLVPSVTDETSALKNKDIDAVWIFYGWAGISAKVRNFDFDYFDFISLNKVFDYYTPVIIANNNYLKSNPDDVKSFLDATKKGYEFAAKNPEEAAQILIDSDTTGSLSGSEELVKESQKWISTKYIDDAESWGVFDAERWDGFYKWLSDNKLVATELKPGTGFTNDFIK